MDQQYYNRVYEPNMAVCHFHANTKTSTPGEDNGYAFLTKCDNRTIIQLDLFNLPPGVKGFHIHQTADMSKGCDSTGSHYNPNDKTHRDLNMPNNHLGDLGNIIVDSAGRCHATIFVHDLPLSGPHSVVGRAMVVHADEDDLGLGGTEDSHKSGSSGARISCGIIELM